MFSPAYQEYVQPLQELCDIASAAILAYYHGEQAVAQEAKADASPLTEADLAAHRILQEGLAPFGLPLLSEESAPAELESRREWDRFWLVDPLDGTREFLGRTGEFTINIALVEDHRPVLGVVAVPLSGLLYAGVPGEGAWKYQRGDWQQIHCRGLQDAEQLVVLTSRRHRGDALNDCLDILCRRPAGIRREFIGSALKFCLLAEGVADFYPRFSPCSEWDTAAGQALLEAAGGLVCTLDGAPLACNTGEDLLNPHFLALADPGHTGWQEIVTVSG